MTILAAFLLTAVLLFFVLEPFLSRDGAAVAERPAVFQSLLDTKHSLLQALGDLELDMKSGRLDEQQYNTARAALETELRNVTALLEGAIK